VELYDKLSQIICRENSHFLNLILPVHKTHTLEEFSDILIKHHFQAHAVKDGIILVKLHLDDSTDYPALDKLTSTVIRHGGTVQP